MVDLKGPWAAELVTDTDAKHPDHGPHFYAPCDGVVVVGGGEAVPVRKGDGVMFLTPSDRAIREHGQRMFRDHCLSAAADLNAVEQPEQPWPEDCTAPDALGPLHGGRR
jgi:hypothetical protein